MIIIDKNVQVLAKMLFLKFKVGIITRVLASLPALVFIIVGCTDNGGGGDENPVAVEVYDITISDLPESLVSIVGIPVSQQFQISVITSSGLYARDVPVNFRLRTGSGNISPSTAQTNDYGALSAVYTVNPTAGQEFVTIEARVSSSTSTQEIRVIGLPRPTELTIFSPLPQVNATFDEQIRIPILATLTDAQGNATAGLEVEFEILPAVDSGATFGSLSVAQLTGLNGVSEVVFRSSGQYGRLRIVCSVLSGGGELANIADTLAIEINSLDDVINFFLMTITPRFVSVAIAVPETAQVEILLRDANNRALAGISTDIDVELGRISGNAVTDSMGQIHLDYIIRHEELPDTELTVFLDASILGTNWRSRANIRLLPEVPGQPTFALVANPKVIWADNGRTTVTLTAILKDSNGEGIINRSVSFGSAIGIAQSPVITDNRGSATSVFSDDGRASLDESGILDSLVITGRVRSMNLESSVNIMIHPYNPVNDIVIVPQQRQVLAGDLDSTLIAITCNGDDGLPVREPNTVHLSAASGRIFPNLVRTENGEAVSYYYPPIATGIDTITGWVDNQNDEIVTGSTIITVIPGPPEFAMWTIEPEVLYIGDPNADAQIDVQLLDRFDNSVGAGFQLIFDTTLGSITEEATTIQNGIATAHLRPGVRPGIAQITIALRGAEQNIGIATVTFLDSPPSSISIEADLLNIYAVGAGDTTSTIIYATVFNEFGSPVINPALVTFQIEDEPAPPVGCAFVTGEQIFIDNTEEGVVAAIVESGTRVGAKKITAYTWRDVERQDTISVELAGMEVIPGVPYSIVLNYDQNGVDIGGVSWTIDVWADVKDILRNPVANGTRVTFALDGEIGEINSGFTNDGIVTVQLRYRGEETFERVNITGTVNTGEEEISDDLSIELPIQEGAITANTSPANWNFEQDREVAQIRIRAELQDGHRTQINNGLIKFLADLGDLYWLDDETGELERFIGGRAQMLTGISDDNHAEEPGQATIYLIAEEDDIFDDPFVAEVVVTVEIVLNNYEDEINTQVEITFTREIE